MTDIAWNHIAAGFAAVGAALSAAIGIGNIAKGAVESVARQPEAANEIRGIMIITAGMIEGVALIAVIIAFILTIQ